MTFYQTLTFATSASPESSYPFEIVFKTFTQLVDARKRRFAPYTPDPLCAKDTRYLIRFARHDRVQRSPHP